MLHRWFLNRGKYTIGNCQLCPPDLVSNPIAHDGLAIEVPHLDVKVIELSDTLIAGEFQSYLYCVLFIR